MQACTHARTQACARGCAHTHPIDAPDGTQEIGLRGVTVVGDDDQSVYGFAGACVRARACSCPSVDDGTDDGESGPHGFSLRARAHGLTYARPAFPAWLHAGARVENFSDFRVDFRSCHTVHLHTNYRSSRSILDLSLNVRACVRACVRVCR